MGKRNLQLGLKNRCTYQRNPKNLTLSYDEKIIVKIWSVSQAIRQWKQAKKQDDESWQSFEKIPTQNRLFDNPMFREFYLRICVHFQWIPAYRSSWTIPRYLCM